MVKLNPVGVGTMFIDNQFDVDTVLMSMAFAVASQSLSNKRKVGAVVVDKQGRIVSYGYNHDQFNPTGVIDDSNCKHAEVAALESIVEDTRGPFTLYTTKEPCVSCANFITRSKVKEVVYSQTDDKDHTGVRTLQRARVATRCHNVVVIAKVPSEDELQQKDSVMATEECALGSHTHGTYVWPDATEEIPIIQQPVHIGTFIGVA
jgi:deoxycytidylate deaminase